MTVTADPLVRHALSVRPRRGNPRAHDARLPAGVPFPVAIVASAIAGGMLDLAYPANGWWPATFVSVTIGLWTLRGRSLPRAFLISLVYGAAFYFTHLVWVSRFLGPIPWVALAGSLKEADAWLGLTNEPGPRVIVCASCVSARGASAAKPNPDNKENP